MKSYKAVRLIKNGTEIQIVLNQLPLHDDLPPGEVLVKVHYSSINFKDIMSCQGNPAVTRHYPHTPGIDAAGQIFMSEDPRFPPGAEVVICCRAMGMNRAGGFAEYVQVPVSWLEHKPVGWSLRECMVVGTAGFTAALAVDAVVKHWACDLDAPVPLIGLNVAVVGATGGVGAFAATMLTHLGARVTAIVGQQSRDSQTEAEFFAAVGISDIQYREVLLTSPRQNLASSVYHAAIDVAGGELLALLIKQLHPQGLAIATGMVAETQLPINVLPFILRGVTLRGINAESTDGVSRQALWQRLEKHYLPLANNHLYRTVDLSQLPNVLERLRQGQRSVGRTLVSCL